MKRCLIIALTLLGIGFNSASAEKQLPSGIKKILKLPVANKTLEFPPSSVGGKTINYDYCSDHERLLVVIAHADDDRYFMGDNIRSAIKAGSCVKVVHLNAGFDINPPSSANSSNAQDSFYYQGRINGAKAVYENMLSNNFSSPVYEANSWDDIEGNTIQRYIISNELSDGVPSGQIIEIQVLGLPNSSNVTAFSNAGNTTSHIYTKHQNNTINIAGKISGYNLSNSYNWDSVVSTLNIVMQWMNPTKILTLDPWGVPGDDAVEGQHPDHIIAARAVNSTDYVNSNKELVAYFKTYNVNSFRSNLSSQLASKTETDLAVHFTHDWGSSFITELPCSSSMQANGNQFTPYSWACKKYNASEDEYFVASTLVNSDGQCLNSIDNKGVVWGECNKTTLPITIGKSKFAFVSNSTDVNNNEKNKFVLYPSPIESGGAIGLINYLNMPNNTRWHYNDNSKKLEFIYDSSDNRRTMYCLGKNDYGSAVLSECEMAVHTFVKKDSAQTFDNDEAKIKNILSNSCLITRGDGIAMGDCSGEISIWKNNNGQLSKVINGKQMCLNAPVFGTGIGSITLNECHKSSPGQIFDIKKTIESNNFTIRPTNDNICLENDLNFYQCHGYKVQQWSLVN
ncbi:MAG: PIG-L family deacetylase [Plesiomonas sp.]